MLLDMTLNPWKQLRRHTSHPDSSSAEDEQRDSEEAPGESQPAHPQNNISEASEELEADEIVAEYEGYQRGIRDLLVRGSIIALLYYGILRYLVWVPSIGSADQPNPQITLLRIPAEIAVAGFGILITLAIALQVAVRSSGEGRRSEAREAARQQYLADFARVLVGATLLYGLTLSVQDWQGPKTIDLVKVFGPILVALIVAVAAADAGTVADPKYGKFDLREAWNKRRQIALERGRRIVVAGTLPASRASCIREAALLFLGPPLVAGLIARLAMRMTILQCGVLMGFGVVLACGVYFLVAKAAQYTATQSWSLLIQGLTLATLFAIMVPLFYITQGLERSGKDGTWGAAVWTVLFYLAQVAVPLGLALRSMRARKLGRRGALRSFSVWRIDRNLLALNRRPADPPKKPTWNTLAIIAPFLSIAPLVGIALGVLAIQQIKRANLMEEGSQRGLGLARTTVWVNVILLAALVTVLLVIGCVNPPIER